MTKYLNIKRISSLLLVLFIVGGCKTSNNNNNNEEPKEVQPIWSTYLESDAIWNGGLQETPIYKDCVIFNSTLEKSAGVEDNRFCGVNIKTGKIEWWFPSNLEETHNDQFNSVGYIDNNYLVTKSFIRGGIKETEEVLCIDLDTQQEVWRKDFTHQSDRKGGVFGKENIAYFCQAKVGEGSYIYSANILTGDTTLIHTIVPEGDRISSTFGNIFTLYKNNLICYTTEVGNGYDDIFINVIDITTNNLTNKIRIPDEQKRYLLNGSVAYDNKLYLGIGHYTICYDMTDWSIVWENNSPYNAPNLDLSNGVLFKSGTNEYEGLNATTGRRLYAREMGTYWVYMDGNYAYVLDRAAKLQIVDIKTGMILDTLVCPEKSGQYKNWHIATEPIVQDGKLYITSHTSAYCYPAYPWDEKTTKWWK